ncbi:MAG TPA: carbohydrate ABC transporter permease [Acholeplasma sp.]|jgi:multiple sugar transport system permease protein|nr:carbohydrate ABC transporter permease [Acholeplasma sp.]
MGFKEILLILLGLAALFGIGYLVVYLVGKYKEKKKAEQLALESGANAAELARAKEIQRKEKEAYVPADQLRAFRVKRTTLKVITYIFLILIALFILIPFYWMVITSFKSAEEIAATKPSLIPNKITFEAYKNIFQLELNPNGTLKRGVPFLYMFGNTILVGFFTTVFTVISVVFSAFAFSRLRFKGSDVLFTILLSTMMVPGEVFIITNYGTVSRLGWVGARLNDDTVKIIGNYLAMILPFIGSVFYTFYLRQTFKQVSDELYYAAKVDGVGDFKYLFKIMIPIAKPTIITITILSLMGSWNAYIWPNLVTDFQNYKMWLVSNGLSNAFRSTIELTGPGNVLNQQMAGSLIVTLPLLIVFFTLKKYIMRGVVRGGTKG